MTRILGGIHSLAVCAGILALPLLLCGCPTNVGTVPNDNDNGNDDGGAVSFAADIQPILTTNCAGCHSPGGVADLAGIALQLREGESYDKMVGQASVQQNDLIIVVPGDEGPYAKVVGDHAGRMHFIAQEEPLGYGHAVYCARDFCGDEPRLKVELL